MKKSAIAIAVAAVMVAPVAMADVKVSGNFTGQIVSVGGDANHPNGLHFSTGGTGLSGITGGPVTGNQDANHTSGISFDASHDLGGGLTAFAHYTMNVSLNSTTTQDTRGAYIGLKGGFGTVMAGKINTAYKTSTIGWDPFLGTFMQARDSGGMGGFASVTLYGAEVAQTIMYANKFGDVDVKIGLAIDDDIDGNANDSTTANHGINASVVVPVGPVTVAVAYLNADDFAQDSGDTLTNNAMKVGVRWSEGPITVAAQYETIERQAGAETADDKNIYLTGSYKMGKNTLSLSYGMLDVDGVSDDITYMALGARHAFSNQVSAYVGYRTTKLDPLPGKPSNDALGVGMNVRF